MASVSKSVDKKIDFLSQPMIDVKGQMLIMNNLAKAVENIEQGHTGRSKPTKHSIKYSSWHSSRSV